MEIEKKFIPESLPESLSSFANHTIEQGYLVRKPTLRIRKWDEQYILTYKNRDGLQKENQEACVCQEVELPLTKEAYDTLKDKTDGNMISKTRYLIPLSQDLTVELDVFHEQLDGLILAEVEFPDMNSATSFIAPAWLGKEVSNDYQYSNSYLSTIEKWRSEEDVQNS